MTRTGLVRCVAHRGTPGGMIPENTAASARVALMSGADAVEVDVSVTVDGQVLAFHDTLERELLGIEENITTLTSEQVRRHPYLRGQIGGRPVHVQTLAQVIGPLRGTGAEVHVDRAWRWWPQVLPVLDELGMDEQVVLKIPGAEEHLAALEALAPACRVAVICSSRAQVLRALESCLDVAIVEFVSNGEPDIHDDDLVGVVHAAGRLAMVNAEVVGAPLWGGHDDETSVLGDPEDGWGNLIERGFDYVQSDFPWLFTSYRDSRGKE